MVFSLPSAAVTALDEHFAREHERWHAPALVYAVVSGGRPLHFRGLGTLAPGGGKAAPGGATSFRIASMTKSFTAAAVLLLRDKGKVRLDDPIGVYVPELEGLRGPTADSPLVTVRHLMTMQSGMPEDDPWGDRLLDITEDGMLALFRSGASFARSSGLAYEYCNYGYAMLGRLVANVAGVPAQRFITDRLLAPLGMMRTTWAPPAADVALGYRWEEDQLKPETPLADGGFSLMGGLWSTVEDLAKWVAFFCDAFPPRDDPDSGPLSRASRREMQQPHRPYPPHVEIADGRLNVLTGAYGMGLVAYHDSDTGSMVSHSGGLPGYGSNMRWWPERGLGLIALANVTYANMERANEQAARILAANAPLRDAVTTRAPGLEAMGRALGELLADWADDAATDFFETNVALDRSFALRRADVAALVERHGALAVDRVEATSLTAGRLWLRGERGMVRAVFDLSSTIPPRVQRYDCTSILEAPAAHEAAAREWLAGEAPEVVVARALIGTLTLGAASAHSGGDRSTFEVNGERGSGAITVVVGASGPGSFEIEVRELARD